MMDKYGVADVRAGQVAELKQVRDLLVGYSKNSEELSKTASAELEQLRTRERELVQALSDDG